VTFVAAFPQIQCIKYLGDGGARIVLDIPQSDEGAVESLRQWRDRLLMVTVVPMAKDNQIYRLEQVGESDGKGRLEARTKRQPKWEATET
jgi:hypothetical protein